MRTTVEISDSIRARLLEIAGRRGEKGFSRFVEEAIEHYLADYAQRATRVKDALAVLGSLSDREAAALEQSVRRARDSWR